MEPITVIGTEFYCVDNAKEHYTQEYDLVSGGTPVLRRGFDFCFAIRFNREFDPETDVIRLQFNFGPKPNVIRGTRAILSVLPNLTHLPKDINRWGVNLVRNDGEIITLRVHIPPIVPIGIWHCVIQTNITGQREIRNDYPIPDDIYIIFNPWCPDDGVFMESEEEKTEYILNETGKIYCGTFKNPSGKHWVFGQFDDIVLPAAVLLMEKSGLSHSDRASPILISRAISAIINSVDDDGLLEGKWDGEYSDGTSPHAWTGSTGIMDQFLSSGGAPVKYGQCWVYAGAVVTVCRALGIPCRPTTNYVSAHDTNMSMTVDKYFDIFGAKIENGPDGDCHDSCWNFHVWNDVWMARPDMLPGYGGWQIIDGTPQELSGQVFRCGPASVAAVRKGEVGYLYDTPFVFSEVNADVVHFKEDEGSDWGFTRLSINKYHVGRKILTKNLGPTDDHGNSDLLDVTRLYKNPEGTEAERLAVYNAVRGIPKAQEFYEIPNKDKEDVFFDLVDIDTVPFGEPFNVVVKLENKSDEERTISAVLSSGSVYYTGAAANDIKKSQGTFKVGPGQSETLSIHVTPEEYLGKLVDHNLIKIYSIATVQETKQTWSEEDDFTLTMPEMTIVVAGMCKVGEECNVEFSFTNPLEIPLTECSYTIEGPGLKKPKTVPYRDVEPKELITLQETFQAKKSGQRQIVANFTCKQIHHLNASLAFNIEE